MSTPRKVQCNSWTRQMLDRLNMIFQPNSYNKQVDALFVNMLRQYEEEKKSGTLSPNVSSANFMLGAGIWGLVRMFETENIEVRRQLLSYVTHLESAENALRKALLLHQQFPPIQPQPLPPDATTTFQNLPVLSNSPPAPSQNVASNSRPTPQPSYQPPDHSVLTQDSVSDFPVSD